MRTQFPTPVLAVVWMFCAGQVPIFRSASISNKSDHWPLLPGPCLDQPCRHHRRQGASWSAYISWLQDLHSLLDILDHMSGKCTSLSGRTRCLRVFSARSKLIILIILRWYLLWRLSRNPRIAGHRAFFPSWTCNGRSILMAPSHGLEGYKMENFLSPPFWSFVVDRRPVDTSYNSSFLE